MMRTCFFNNNPNVLNLETNLNVELEKVSQWFYAKKLSLNNEKSNFVEFHSRQRIAHKLNLSNSNTVCLLSLITILHI